MSRNPIAPATKVGPELIGHTPPEDAAAQEKLREHQHLIIAEWGDGLPWNPDHYEAVIRRELKVGFEALLRAGRYLIVARECAAHGEWHGLLDRLGIDRSVAHRMMEASRRVANVATSQRLLEVAGNQGKLFELLSLPEDQFAELAEEGETNGLKRDDIEKMTVRELRQAVREAREDLAAKDQRAGIREREIERVGKELRKARRLLDEATPEQTTQELRQHASAAALDVRAKIVTRGEDVSSLRTRAEQLLSHGRDTGVDQGVFLAGLFAEIERDLAALRDELGIAVAVAADATPEWLAQAKAAGEL